MILYKKVKKEFIEINDLDSLKIGDIVKIYSETTNKFINKHLYFINKIDTDKLYCQNMSTMKELIFNKTEKSLECAS